MNKLCECANLEWKPEYYSLEHHPDCRAVNVPSVFSLPRLNGTHLTIEGTVGDAVNLYYSDLADVPFVMPSIVSIEWPCRECGQSHARPVRQEEDEQIIIECLSTPATPPAGS
jgi:hypothetical protein